MWMIEANGIRGTANVADDVPQVVVKLISYFGRRKNSVEIFQLSFDKGLFLPPSQKVERSSWVSHVVTDDWNDIFNRQTDRTYMENNRLFSRNLRLILSDLTPVMPVIWRHLSCLSFNDTFHACQSRHLPCLSSKTHVMPIRTRQQRRQSNKSRKIRNISYKRPNISNQKLFFTGNNYQLRQCLKIHQQSNILRMEANAFLLAPL